MHLALESHSAQSATAVPPGTNSVVGAEERDGLEDGTSDGSDDGCDDGSDDSDG